MLRLFDGSNGVEVVAGWHSRLLWMIDGAGERALHASAPQNGILPSSGLFEFSWSSCFSLKRALD